MKKTLLILPLLTALAACSGQIDAAKQSLEALISTSRQDIEYQSLKEYQLGVVCGEFSEFDPREGRTEFKRFIYRDGRARQSPTGNDWEIFCSKDPAQALFSQLGIGPYSKDNATILKVHRDLLALQSALDAYRNDYKGVPAMNIGLQALAGDNLSQTTYLEAVPLDPWKRDYVYDSNQLGFGRVAAYKLSTLGADGVAGGQGDNADIGIEHLKYLNHIEKTQK